MESQKRTKCIESEAKSRKKKRQRGNELYIKERGGPCDVNGPELALNISGLTLNPKVGLKDVLGLLALNIQGLANHDGALVINDLEPLLVGFLDLADHRGARQGGEWQHLISHDQV